MYNTQSYFNTALYDERCKSIPDFLTLYAELLLNGLPNTDFSEDEDLRIAHSNRIKQYHREITNKQYLYELRKNFNAIYKLIDKTYPHIRFSIVGRRKSVVSIDKKIIRNIIEQKSLDLIRDTNGFRILIFGESSNELLQDCYNVMNSIISFIQKNGYNLCGPETADNEQDCRNVMNSIISLNQKKGYNLNNAKKVDNNFDVKSNHPEILIPQVSGIKECFLYGVKDYIFNPKPNGYQSLQCVFRKPTGECVEVQVRTFDMHMYAESGNAKHSNYKQQKYNKCLVSFDRNKIHIPGYGISAFGELFDFIGFEKSIEILKRQKTF